MDVLDQPITIEISGTHQLPKKNHNFHFKLDKSIFVLSSLIRSYTTFQGNNYFCYYRKYADAESYTEINARLPTGKQSNY